MALPSVKEIISDGNLNLVGGSSENTIVKLGVCTAGQPYVLQAFGTQNAMTSALGSGSLCENLAYQLDIAGGPVVAMAIPASIAGSLGSVSHVGSGSGSIDGYAVSHQTVLITISSGGALGVGQFTSSVNGGPTSAPSILPAGGTYLVPGTYAVISFGAGTYVLADTYSLGISSDTVTHSGSGSPTVTASASPLDNYSMTITVTKAGAIGTAQGTFTLDGYSISAPFVFPASGNYAVPNSGLAIQFFGTFVLGDTYSFLTCGPSFSSGDLTTALNTLNSTYLSTPFSMISVVQGGALSSAANAQTQAAAVQVQCEGLFNNGVDVRALVECPTLGSVATVSGVLTVDSADTDTVLETAFLNLSANRVGVCAGDSLLAGPLSGLTLRRNASWVVSARLAEISASTDGGWVQLGGVSGVSALYRDEFQTEGLDNARFTTLRTIVGDPGFFITNVKTMASLGSDYAFMTNARVIDLAARVARQWALPLINSKVPITQNPNAVAGSIALGAALKLDASLSSVLNTSLVTASPQNAVAAAGTVDTSHNVLGDGILPITVAIVPYAYARQIVITLGFAVRI